MTLSESPRDRGTVLESILRIVVRRRNIFVDARSMVRELIAEIRRAREAA